MFCKGMGRVMMPGFQTTYNPSKMIEGNSCILWLFQGAVVDTPGKYALACIGSFSLVLAMVFLQLVRERVSLWASRRSSSSSSSSSSPSSPSLCSGGLPMLGLDLAVAALFALQMVLAYWIMLLVMLYEAWIFTSIIIGFFVSQLLAIRLRRRWRERTCGCPSSSEQAPLVAGSKMDTVHAAAASSPCCGGDGHGAAI
ncbi:uncharacterized protein AMSG_11814 [Thecamonas trahens ATCC 50062]|uniref:Copper transport protein n=1 Tax=Thecamonas trahens ATCC 50062 TaxID=461836 RepID=A0A0L0D9P1_THETB|nr:hypothetical protein AMSG_11814 [Thecamonas trahens ATCC 50062]KNC48970.1 hypothetical protein AMSG_11814 [Thecamonas trahens ATCC 50062]|eukprot:XP_013758450.1 hypothetical protein AMSG_11814 [Thecamonas trahens ATCC 50062]